jgi:hypothetical protein
LTKKRQNQLEKKRSFSFCKFKTWFFLEKNLQSMRKVSVCPTTQFNCLEPSKVNYFLIGSNCQMKTKPDEDTKILLEEVAEKYESELKKIEKSLEVLKKSEHPFETFRKHDEDPFSEIKIFVYTF